MGTQLIAQRTKVSELAWADSTLHALYDDQVLDAGTKSLLSDSLFNIYSRYHQDCNQINARILQATQLDNQGLSDSALTILYWTNTRYNEVKCDSDVLMSLYRNLTNVYLSLGELERVDSISTKAIRLWNPKWKDKDPRLAILNNWAIALVQMEDDVKASITFHQAYREAIEDYNSEYIQIALNNLGSLKGFEGDLDSAYYFLQEAKRFALQEKNSDNLMSLLINLANVESERGNHADAFRLLDSAYVLADTLNSLEKMAKVQIARSSIFAILHDYKRAYTFLNEYITLNNQYLDEERVKAVTEMMEKYESEKKARQIQQLQVDNLDAALKNERITKTRNHYIYLGSGILLVALGLWWRLTYVHKSKRAIQHEKDISEGLLLNILPASVADELKLNGHAEARNFPAATILFSDFKSFTNISETLSAEDLVSELNVCFRAFDEIMSKHGLEKIKTIGDAYMAAASVPATNTATAVEAVKAGLEMQEFIRSRKSIRDEQQQVGFQMRVGIHSGPVVAGIVGVKKFQYDVWGDTVNIANRMETNSEIGQVNISEATYQLVQDYPEFSFIPRGLIEAKGKGEMQMYFVETSW